MSVLEKIQAFGIGVYEETLAVPETITLPLRAHDQLKRECAARMAEPPHVVPGTISCIQIETGYGIIKVLPAGIEPGRYRSQAEVEAVYFPKKGSPDGCKADGG